MNELYTSIKCLCDSPQRLRILVTLDSTRMDLRSLKSELESPRTTLQRNLSILKQRGWIEETRSKYTTTTAGHLILEEIVAVVKNVEIVNSILPFLEAVDTPTALDVGQLSDPLMTVPEPTQPNAPMKRLLDALNGADRIRGLLPAVSWLLIEVFPYEEDTTKHEYIVSQDVLNALQKRYAAEGMDTSEMNQLARTDIHIYKDELPYGLFISEDRLALTAYNRNGRIQALVESESETAIKWGERVYENHKRQSQLLD